jgi:hypothetical protein
MDWQRTSKSIRRAYFGIWQSNDNLDTWVIGAKVNGDLMLTADELAQFYADVSSLDNAYVDELDFEMDLADAVEWQRTANGNGR